MADVICVGIAGLDVLITGADFSAGFAAETLPAERVELALGGDAANEATVLSRLGVDVTLMCGVGADAAGRTIRALLEEANVTGTQICPLPVGISSALNVILVHRDGQRHFINVGSPAPGWTPDHEAFRGAKIVSLASFGLPPFTDTRTCVRSARAAKEQGCIVCADVVCAAPDMLALIAPALPYVDYLFPNEEEAGRITGRNTPEDMAAVLRERGLQSLVIKTGARGCYLSTREGAREIPAVSCDTVVDTTGAGDSFLAGFIRAKLDGRPDADCCRYAAAVAAASIQNRGAGIRDQAQVAAVLERLSTQGNKGETS